MNEKKSLQEILSLMARIDNTYKPGSLFGEAVDRFPLLIKEGLIKSYPVSAVAKAISDIFTLDFEGNVSLGAKMREKPVNGRIWITTENGDDEVIFVELNNTGILDDMNHYFLKYGWFDYRSDDNIYRYERKFGDRFSVRQLRNVTSEIYHITTIDLKKKIEREGLVPKESKTPGFNNEDRLYFMLEKPTPDDISAFSSMKQFDKPCIVVGVDLGKLPSGQSFFFDPRWQNSIFTFEPIPKNAIRILDESEFPKFRLR